jgi:5'-deoxynucleotidase YfbR-like HD superfamily hydrolase
VIGDMISPFKAVIGEAYKGVEERLLGAVRLRFGLPAVPGQAVTTLAKTADRAAAFLEATRLAGFATEEALRFFGRPAAVPPEAEALLEPCPAEEAKALFLARFQALEGARA